MGQGDARAQTQDTSATENADQEVNAGQEVRGEDVRGGSSEADQEVDASETVIKTGEGSVRITEEPTEDEVGVDSDEEQA